MESQTNNKYLLIEQYPNEIEGIISTDDFLSNLKKSIATPGNTIEAHEIPGTKTICGTVEGDRFKLRKAGAFANPYGREVVGIVEQSNKSGCTVKYKLNSKTVIAFFNGIVVLGISAIALLSAIGIVMVMNYMSMSELGRAIFVSIGIPFAFLILFLFYTRFAESTGVADEEELLDHLKKHAAGINVSS